VKILLLGADGQVGFELQRSLAPLGTLVPTTRGGRLPGGASCRALDLADFDSVRALVMDERPDWILNAAADTRVDEAERETERAFRINGHAVGALGAAAAAVGCIDLRVGRRDPKRTVWHRSTARRERAFAEDRARRSRRLTRSLPTVIIVGLIWLAFPC